MLDGRAVSVIEGGGGGGGSSTGGGGGGGGGGAAGVRQENENTPTTIRTITRLAWLLDSWITPHELTDFIRNPPFQVLNNCGTMLTQRLSPDKTGPSRPHIISLGRQLTNLCAISQHRINVSFSAAIRLKG